MVCFLWSFPRQIFWDFKKSCFFNDLEPKPTGSDFRNRMKYQQSEVIKNAQYEIEYVSISFALQHAKTDLESWFYKHTNNMTQIP